MFFAEVEVPSANVLEVDARVLLLENDASCTENVGSVYPRLVVMSASKTLSLLLSCFPLVLRPLSLLPSVASFCRLIFVLEPVL